MSLNVVFKGTNIMTDIKPERVDKIQYYNKLPLSHLLKEASCAENLLSNDKNITEEKLADSKLILDELKKRMIKN